MIGIQQLDNLTTDQMVDVITGKIKILVRDPIFVQRVVKNYPEPGDFEKSLLPHDKVITLLKMELESRLGWAHVAERIKEIDAHG